MDKWILDTKKEIEALTHPDNHTPRYAADDVLDIIELCERLEKELEFTHQVERSQAKDLSRLEKMDKEKTKWHMKTIKEMNRINDLNSKLQRIVACVNESDVYIVVQLLTVGCAKGFEQCTPQLVGKFENLQQAIKESK